MIAAYDRASGWLMAVEDTPSKLARRLEVSRHIVEEALGTVNGLIAGKRGVPEMREGLIIKRLAK